MTLAELDH